MKPSADELLKELESIDREFRDNREKGLAYEVIFQKWCVDMGRIANNAREYLSRQEAQPQDFRQPSAYKDVPTVTLNTTTPMLEAQPGLDRKKFEMQLRLEISNVHPDREKNPSWHDGFKSGIELILALYIQGRFDRKDGE